MNINSPHLFWRLAVGAFCLGSLTGFAAPAVRKAAPLTIGATHGAGLEEFIRLYQSDESSIERFYDLPWSSARFDRLKELFTQWEDHLVTVDFEALDQQG